MGTQVRDPLCRLNFLISAWGLNLGVFIPDFSPPVTSYYLITYLQDFKLILSLKMEVNVKRTLNNGADFLHWPLKLHMYLIATGEKKNKDNDFFNPSPLGS